MVRAGLALALLTVLGCAHPDIGSELPHTPLSTLTLSAAKAPESPAPVPIVPAPPAPNDKPLPINLATALQLAGTRPIDIDLAVEAHSVGSGSARTSQGAMVADDLPGHGLFPTRWANAEFCGRRFRHQQKFVHDRRASLPQSLPSPMRSSLRWPSDRPSEHARRRVRQRTNDSLLRRWPKPTSMYSRLAANWRGRSMPLTALPMSCVRPKNCTRAAKASSPMWMWCRRSSAPKCLTANRPWKRLANAGGWRVPIWLGCCPWTPAATSTPWSRRKLRVTLISPDKSLDDLIPVGLMNRPELAAQQALVQATLVRLRQEKLRPLIPSVLLRGASTNPAGTLAAGYFGGGVNSDLSNLAHAAISMYRFFGSCKIWDSATRRWSMLAGRRIGSRSWSYSVLRIRWRMMWPRPMPRHNRRRIGWTGRKRDSRTLLSPRTRISRDSAKRSRPAARQCCCSSVRRKYWPPSRRWRRRTTITSPRSPTTIGRNFGCIAATGQPAQLLGAGTACKRQFSW